MDDVQQWRPRRAVRIAGAVIAIAFTAAVAVEADLGAGGGQMPVPVAVVAALVGAWFACVGLGYLWRCRITLGNDVLTVTGVFRTHRIPVQNVIRARTGKHGIAFDQIDGRRVVSRGLEISLFESWLRDHTQPSEVVVAVSAAAEQARERHSPAPVDAATIHRNKRRRANSLYVRAAVGIVAMAVLFYGELHHTVTSSPQKAAQPTQPAVTVGECLRDASISDFDLKPIPCTSSHDAQIFSIVDTTSGDGCDSSLILNGRLPQDHSEATLMTSVRNTPTTICFVITPAITHSVVQGH